MITITVATLDEGPALMVDASDIPNVPDAWWQPMDGGNIGCMFSPMNPETVGISQEALDILANMPRTMGDLGHVDMFDAGGTRIIGWLGPPVVYHDPEAELSNDFKMPPKESYSLIPNTK